MPADIHGRLSRDDDAERAAITTVIQSLGDAWVGIVRDPGGTAPWPWRYVTGGAASYQPWQGAEPNNMSADQYVAVLRMTSGFLCDWASHVRIRRLVLLYVAQSAGRREAARAAL